MGWLSGDKDKTQDQSLDNLAKQIQNLWTWVQHFDANWKIQIGNNKFYTDSIKTLKAKDGVHDKKDAEHDALIQGIKTMAKSVEQAEK